MYTLLALSTGALRVVAAAKSLAPTAPAAFALGVPYQAFTLLGSVLALFFVIV